MIFNIFRKKITANCGHKTHIQAKIKAFDTTRTITIPVVEGKIDYCHHCLEEMTIQCAWCGKAIFIGDPVTLYSKNKDCKIPDYAVLYKEHGHDAYVGCLRWDCADTGADRAGF